MKKILCVLLLIFCLALCSCEMSKAGTTADVNMKDLAISAVSETEIDFTDRDQEFSFRVEVDQSTIVGDDLYYNWYLYLWDGGWGDMTFYVVDDDPNTLENNSPVYDQNVTCGFYDGTPINFGLCAEPGCRYKLTCVAVNHFPGSDSSERKCSASADFFINVDPDLGALSGYDIYDILFPGQRSE